jgi:multiple sugar transport system permease protein
MLGSFQEQQILWAEVGLHSTRNIARKRYTSREISTALGFILPSLTGFLIFFAWPLFKGLFISFTDWDLLGKARYIGLDNYKNLIADGEFWNSLWVTLQYVLWNIPIQTLLAMGIALIMKRIKSSSLLRGALIVPWFLPNVVVALLALAVLDPSIGIVNEGLKALGLRPMSFLTTTQLAMPSIAGINTWKFMGYTALIIFAGLQGIPHEVEEAALIDGATGWTAFRKITLPLLRPVLAFVVVTSVIGSFQVYDTVAVATRGGPVNSTWVMNFFIFKNAFEGYRMGYATAASMVLFALLVGVGFLQIRMMRAGESD